MKGSSNKTLLDPAPDDSGSGLPDDLSDFNASRYLNRFLILAEPNCFTDRAAPLAARQRSATDEIYGYAADHVKHFRVMKLMCHFFLPATVIYERHAPRDKLFSSGAETAFKIIGSVGGKFDLSFRLAILTRR